MAKRAPSYIELPATISKAEFASVCELCGRRNGRPLAGYRMGALELAHFVGTFDIPSRTFTGAYQFLEVERDVKADSFDVLPGLEKKPEPAPVAEES